MADDVEKPEPGKPRVNKWVVFAILLSVGIFMYVSIMFKIIHFGP